MSDEIFGLLRELLATMLSRDVHRTRTACGISEDTLTARIEISGAWCGSVFFWCSRSTAALLASWFADLPQPVDPEDVSDALGELVNVAAGNLKALLPGPSSLLLPVVDQGAPELDLTGEALSLQLTIEDQPLQFALLEHELEGSLGSL